MTTKTKKAAKKPTAPEPSTSTTLSEREREWGERIRQLETECERLEEVHIVAKEEAKHAKEALEAAVAHLRTQVKNGPDAQLGLTFDGDGEPYADDDEEADA